MTKLTQRRLKELLKYDPDTGVFTRLTSLGGRKEGSVAGCVDRETGYVRVSVDGQHFHGHRLAWLYMTGEWPPEDTDHINLNKSDNRWVNLRAASRTQNMANTPPRADNTSGVKGVSWHKQVNKWRAQIYIDKRAKHLGLFVSFDDAVAAYASAAKEVFGNFSRAAG